MLCLCIKCSVSYLSSVADTGVWGRQPPANTHLFYSTPPDPFEITYKIILNFILTFSTTNYFYYTLQYLLITQQPINSQPTLYYRNQLEMTLFQECWLPAEPWHLPLSFIYPLNFMKILTSHPRLCSAYALVSLFYTKPRRI